MIQVIERFHKIMEIVAAAPEEVVRLSDFAKALDVSLPTCSGIVKTMTLLGYLRSLGPRNGFVMGDTPYFLTRRGPFRRYLVEPAMPLMKKLEDEVNEFVVLVTENNGNRYELIRLESNAILRVNPDPKLRNLFQSSTGCTILAHKSDDEISEYWNNYPENDNCLCVNSLNEFLKECKNIRKLGYCLLEPESRNPEDLTDSSAAMGFPVHDGGKIVAAVGIMLPALRMINGNREKIISAGRKTAKEIELKIQSKNQKQEMKR
jgi:DNA-binding IclR family transcriptional regulator